MFFSPYVLLPQEGDEDLSEKPQVKTLARSRIDLYRRYLSWLLLVSLLANAFQSVFLFSKVIWSEASPITLYANLRQNVSSAFAKPSQWADYLNETDPVWDQEYFNLNFFTVAVDLEWAAAKGLPTSQAWPWDENKIIYQVHAMHLLHCTKFIHTSLQEYHDGKPQSFPWRHVQHCVRLLRDDVFCNADDSLVYTGRLHGQEEVEIPVPGLGQERKCKNWGLLVEWIRERSACFWPIPSTGPDFQESERYKFCPNGKVYW